MDTVASFRYSAYPDGFHTSRFTPAMQCMRPGAQKRRWALLGLSYVAPLVLFSRPRHAAQRPIHARSMMRWKQLEGLNQTANKIHREAPKPAGSVVAQRGARCSFSPGVQLCHVKTPPPPARYTYPPATSTSTRWWLPRASNPPYGFPDLDGQRT